MAEAATDTVRTFYQGIAARDAAVATSVVDADRFVQHDPHLADGVAGLRLHIGALPPEGPGLRIARILTDGDLVVVHGEQASPEPLVFFAVHRLAAGRIVEQWVFTSPAAPPNQSGHTQVDGPTQPAELDRGAANRAFVRGYYEAFHIGGQHDRIGDYTDGATMIRHEPGVADGVEAFRADLAVLIRDRTIDEIGLLAGQGDLVFIAARGTHAGAPSLYIDLYRVADGKLVEHWGFPVPVPPRVEWKNANGPL